MARLLYIQASPRPESTSSSVARDFLSIYRDLHPKDEIDTLNLFETELPRFDGETLQAKYRVLNRQAQQPSEAKAWQDVVKVAERFKAADRYLLSIPMWNFSIPYVLKHYIDLITQPGITFQFTPGKGYEGLIKGRPAVAIYARGGAYTGAEGEALDFQKRYVELMLGFIGFEKIHSIVAEPTLGDPAEVASARKALSPLVQKIARELA